MRLVAWLTISWIMSAWFPCFGGGIPDGKKVVYLDAFTRTDVPKYVLSILDPRTLKITKSINTDLNVTAWLHALDGTRYLYATGGAEPHYYTIDDSFAFKPASPDVIKAPPSAGAVVAIESGNFHVFPTSGASVVVPGRLPHVSLLGFEATVYTKERAILFAGKNIKDQAYIIRDFTKPELSWVPGSDQGAPFSQFMPSRGNSGLAMWGFAYDRTRIDRVFWADWRRGNFPGETFISGVNPISGAVTTPEFSAGPFAPNLFEYVGDENIVLYKGLDTSTALLGFNASTGKELYRVVVPGQPSFIELNGFFKSGGETIAILAGQEFNVRKGKFIGPFPGTRYSQLYKLSDGRILVFWDQKVGQFDPEKNQIIRSEPLDIHGSESMSQITSLPDGKLLIIPKSPVYYSDQLYQ